MLRGVVIKEKMAKRKSEAVSKVEDSCIISDGEKLPTSAKTHQNIVGLNNLCK
jgi:hypothetical protein